MTTYSRARSGEEMVVQGSAGTGISLTIGRSTGRGDRAFADFPGQLTAIGERLLDLPPQTRVLSGHGEETTIGDATKRFDGWVSAGPGGDLG